MGKTAPEKLAEAVNRLTAFAMDDPYDDRFMLVDKDHLRELEIAHDLFELEKYNLTCKAIQRAECLDRPTGPYVRFRRSRIVP